MTPDVLTQKELDDAVILSREVLQRMINDILSDGIPIPIHPLFKLTKPKVMFHAVHAAHEVRSSDEGGGVTPTEYIFVVYFSCSEWCFTLLIQRSDSF